MKKLLTILICLFAIRVCAQINVDSIIGKSSTTISSIEDTLSKDTINISKIVEQQILAAKLKMESESKKNNISTNSNTLAVNEVSENIKPKKTITQLFFNLSFEVKIILIFSSFLFTFVAIRRIVIKNQRKERAELKKKISLLREEKVPLQKAWNSTKIDEKKSKSRRELIHELPVKKLSEKNISKKAKELNISKGELLLAARLKYLELANGKQV